MPMNIEEAYYADESGEQPVPEEQAAAPAEGIQLSPEQMEQARQLAASGAFEELGRLIAPLIA